VAAFSSWSVLAAIWGCEPLAPNASLGIGIFHRKPRTYGFPVEPQLDKSRRGKKVEMGLRLNF